MTLQMLLITIAALSLIGFVLVALKSPAPERRNQFAQLFAALAVGAVFLLMTAS